ncbi:hypothetical protein K3495_g11250 [Podosphaera aphanis]|nr:hypothetical protein K3495_g11250 [Podosphaera aphanis]
MTSNAKASSYTHDVPNCLLEDSKLQILHEQMDNVEFPWIDNEVNHYCGDAHQSDRARLENEQDLVDEQNFSSIPNPPSSTYNSYPEAEKYLHDFSRREGFEITLGRISRRIKPKISTKED